MKKTNNSDYIRRIDAKASLSALPLTLDAETVQRCIETLCYTPAADVVPVVRCRDCAFGSYESKYGWWCGDKEVSPDWFCADGQRRELSHEVITAGNCTVCGKPLETGRMFLCKECQEKNNQNRV